MPPGCTLLNRPADRTIYPPVAQAWFVLVHVLVPGPHGSRPWQLAGGLLDDLTIVLIALELRQERRDPRQVAWYALCPLPVIEFAGNGHIDGLALLLLVAAVLALRKDRLGWAGLLVGLATMIKLYPGLALAAWWRQGRWRLVLPAIAVTVLAEAPHILIAGTWVLGYLPGYLKEEHYGGGRYLLPGLLGLPDPVTTAIAATLVAGVTIWVAWRRFAPANALSVVLAGLILVAAPVQPWYAATAAGLGALAGTPCLAILGLAAEPYYAAIILADPHQVAAGRVAYSLALATIAYFYLQKRPSRKVVVARPKATTRSGT